MTNKIKASRRPAMRYRKNAVDPNLKLSASLAVPASATTPETAQSEAERWAEERKRGWTNKASDKRADILNSRAVEAGGVSWSTVESAVIDGVIALPMIPAWYKPKRGPKSRASGTRRPRRGPKKGSGK